MPNVTASVDAATIRAFLNWDWATDPDSAEGFDTYWWYCVSVRFDPNEAWMEDDDGTLYVVPFTTDGVEEITVTGPPVRSLLTAVPAQASAGVTATAVADRRSQRIAAEGLDRPDKPAGLTAEQGRLMGRLQREAAVKAPQDKTPTTASAAESEESTMDENVRKALVALGFDAEQATDEQKAQAEALVGAGWEPEPDPEPGAPAPAAEAPEGEPETEPEAEPVAVAASAGTVVVDAATLAEIQRQAKEGADVAAETRAKEEQSVIADAMKAGKFPASRKAHYESAMKVDREGTLKLLTASVEDGGLAPGLVPVEEIGTSETGDEITASVVPDENGLLPESVSILTPAERARRAGS